MIFVYMDIAYAGYALCIYIGVIVIRVGSGVPISIFYVLICDMVYDRWMTQPFQTNLIFCCFVNYGCDILIRTIRKSLTNLLLSKPEKMQPCASLKRVLGI